MKIFLSHKKPQDNSYKWASNLSMMDGMVLDNEATEIICEDFVSSFSQEESIALFQKIFSKMRIGCVLTISEVDSSVLFKKFYLEETTLDELNSILFNNNQKRKSVLNLQKIHESLPNGIQVEEKYYDYNQCRTVVKSRRK
tara:strand:- start:3866 stop:4288 length:423 start_codon:yes stop_codon:yes gene_type:complete